MKKLFTTLLSVFFTTSVVFAQDAEVSITTPYAQNFNGIGTSPTATLPVGWRIDKQNSGNADYRKVLKYANASTQTELVGGNNLSSGGGLFNFGAGDAEAALDRSVGFMGSNSSLRNGNLYLRIKNSGTEDISDLYIAYDIEKYRKSSHVAGIRIQLFYSINGETWADAGTDFYKLFDSEGVAEGYDQAPGETVRISAKLPQAITAGSSLYLAWNYSVNSGSGGINGSPALGIDNVLIGDYETTLPLKFTSFNTQLNGLINKQALLRWTTEQEQNTDYFEIQRAGSSSAFEKVGTLAAANTGGQHLYSFTDSGLLSGVSYYRIKQVDKDGKYTYSEIKSVKNDIISMSVYPNPTTHSISVVVPQGLDQGKLVIYNSMGQKMLTKNNITSTHQIDVSQFDTGFYLIEISKQNHKEIVKFLKQ